jgi:hypothetical protein
VHPIIASDWRAKRSIRAENKKEKRKIKEHGAQEEVG